MAKLSISAAARAWGVSRQTIYNRISEGVLSVTKDANGQTEIDTTEMLRVFGEPSAAVDALETVTALSNGKGSDVLRHQIEVETLKRTAAEERAEMLEMQLMTLQRQIERLEARDAARDRQLETALENIKDALRVVALPAPASTPPPKKGFLDRILGS